MLAVYSEVCVPVCVSVSVCLSVCLSSCKSPNLHCFSAGLRWVQLMLQHWAHSRNRPTATDEKTRKVFSVLVVIFWLVQFRENHLNCCHQMSYFTAKMHRIRLCTPDPAGRTFSALLLRGRRGGEG